MTNVGLAVRILRDAQYPLIGVMKTKSRKSLMDESNGEVWGGIIKSSVVSLLNKLCCYQKTYSKTIWDENESWWFNIKALGAVSQN